MLRKRYAAGAEDWHSSTLVPHRLITEANELLKLGGFEYALCGGYAIELFLNRTIRKHGDIDVSAYWQDRDKIILYMQSSGWEVYEMCGGGIAHHITDVNIQIKTKRNIFCFKEGCSLVKLSPQGETDMYYLDFDHSGQTKLDFIEFLFNSRNAESFIYARNENIMLPITKAILTQNGIPYLAPELILLYKSTDTEREGYQLDYDSAMVKMSAEQKDWLQTALKVINPSGHKWLSENELYITGFWPAIDAIISQSAYIPNGNNRIPTGYMMEWQALGLAQRPQSWTDCDEEIRRYIIGLVDLFKQKLKDNLLGVYLHGSLATGSYFPPKSDIDLIIVVKQIVKSDTAKELNFYVAKYSELRPIVGSIELSVITIKTALTTPSVMPYELHYSESWHQRILDDQVEYGKQPIDPDLPAHLRCVKKRGMCLYGKPIAEVFGDVEWQSFMAAILDDFDWIVKDDNICDSPYYGVLNICRVLQVLKEDNQKELSKYEGAVWGLGNLPHEHMLIIQKALIVYASDVTICENERKTGGVDWDRTALLSFRDYAKDVREEWTQKNI
ncbi:MAG: DUF4111 domain-containing protein [Ruminiclostridium sp.]|nr:DUF4111 domain-containing protein [Ruminiclostridium sp.]